MGCVTEHKEQKVKKTQPQQNVFDFIPTEENPSNLRRNGFY
jgi:hypothetical protein